jgi:hypothetical protein
MNAVFNPALEIVHRSGQQLLIEREHFLADGILQLLLIMGGCTHGTSGTPRGRNHMMTSQETLGAMAPNVTLYIYIYIFKRITHAICCIYIYIYIQLIPPDDGQ